MRCPNEKQPSIAIAPFVSGRHFALVLRQARRTAESCLNRPGVVELRRADERFYVARRVVGDGVGTTVGIWIWSHKKIWVMITLPCLKGNYDNYVSCFFESLPLRFTVFICFSVSLLCCFSASLLLGGSRYV